MKIDEFMIETKTLEDLFGRKLNTTQINIWFEQIQNYKLEDYRETIKKICQTENYMPSLAKVLEELRLTRRNNTAEEEKVPCKLCHGTGYYLYKEKINGFMYEKACLCVCQNAEGKQYDGTKCSEKEHRQPFYLKTAKEVFGDNLK